MKFKTLSKTLPKITTMLSDSSSVKRIVISIPSLIFNFIALPTIIAIIDITIIQMNSQSSRGLPLKSQWSRSDGKSQPFCRPLATTERRLQCPQVCRELPENMQIVF